MASAVRIQRDGFLRKRTIVIDALLDNLSMSGAGLFVPADSDLKSGTAAEVQIDGAWGHVRLVRVTPTANPGTVYCGVLFHEANPDFHEAVLRLL